MKRANVCYDCGPYQRAQNKNAFCGKDLCGIRDKLNIDGTCTTCPAFMKLSDSG